MAMALARIFTANSRCAGCSQAPTPLHWSSTTCSAGFQAATARLTPEPYGDSMSIQAMKDALQTRVRNFNMTWDIDMELLAVGALAMYQLRLGDMSAREHALLLWIVEGDRYLRCHRRTVYVYTNFVAFQQLRDCPPEATFGRVKDRLLRPIRTCHVEM